MTDAAPVEDVEMPGYPVVDAAGVVGRSVWVRVPAESRQWPERWLVGGVVGVVDGGVSLRVRVRTHAGFVELVRPLRLVRRLTDR